MTDEVSIILKKYELVVKNMEFLDSWVMKITATYCVFIFAIFGNIENIGKLNKSIPFIISGIIITGFLFSVILLRILKLMRLQKKTLQAIEDKFIELKVGHIIEDKFIELNVGVKKISVLPTDWGSGYCTTTLCMCYIILTTIISVIAVLYVKYFYDYQLWWGKILCVLQCCHH